MLASRQPSQSSECEGTGFWQWTGRWTRLCRGTDQQRDSSPAKFSSYSTLAEND